jgi:hypothetical protein
MSVKRRGPSAGRSASHLRRFFHASRRARVRASSKMSDSGRSLGGVHPGRHQLRTDGVARSRHEKEKKIILVGRVVYTLHEWSRGGALQTAGEARCASGRGWAVGSFGSTNRSRVAHIRATPSPLRSYLAEYKGDDPELALLPPLPLRSLEKPRRRQIAGRRSREGAYPWRNAGMACLRDKHQVSQGSTTRSPIWGEAVRPARREADRAPALVWLIMCAWAHPTMKTVVRMPRPSTVATAYPTS